MHYHELISILRNAAYQGYDEDSDTPFRTKNAMVAKIERRLDNLIECKWGQDIEEEIQILMSEFISEDN